MKNKQRYCGVSLTKFENKDTLYFIFRDTSGIVKLSEVVYTKENEPPHIHLLIKASSDVIFLRKEVADREFGGIENLVQELKSGKIEYSELNKKFKRKI